MYILKFVMVQGCTWLMFIDVDKVKSAGWKTDDVDDLHEDAMQIAELCV